MLKILGSVFLSLLSVFVFLLVWALVFRFTATWYVDVFGWVRQVLNDLAGAVGA